MGGMFGGAPKPQKPPPPPPPPPQPDPESEVADKTSAREAAMKRRRGRAGTTETLGETLGG